jgi:hypothetical protein
MKDVQLPDLSKVRGSDDNRELPPQASAEDTSNWDNRAIALPDPKRSSTQFIMNDSGENNVIDESMLTNPYIEQERFKTVKRKK